MIEIKKIDLNALQVLVDYFLQNRNNIQGVISDFGIVEKDNEYGTLFLRPTNPLFKVFWISLRNNTIKSIGFGGSHLGLFLEDLHSVYQYHTEGYSHYDEEYVYVFYIKENYIYTVNITSSEQLFKDGNVINNISINRIEIRLGSVPE